MPGWRRCAPESANFLVGPSPKCFSRQLTSPFVLFTLFWFKLHGMHLTLLSSSSRSPKTVAAATAAAGEHTAVAAAATACQPQNKLWLSYPSRVTPDLFMKQTRSIALKEPMSLATAVPNANGGQARENVFPAFSDMVRIRHQKTALKGSKSSQKHSRNF
jgi:hypothetical protein